MGEAENGSIITASEETVVTDNAIDRQKTANKNSKAPKKSWVKGLKAEFSKIIWPDKKSVVRQTAAVVAVSVFLGALIKVLDMIIKFGINLLS